MYFQVCKEWNELVRSPGLWSVVNLNEVPGECRLRRRHKCHTSECRELYNDHVSQYLIYLQRIDPPVLCLSFTYDIYTNHNRYDSYIIIIYFILILILLFYKSDSYIIILINNVFYSDSYIVINI